MKKIFDKHFDKKTILDVLKCNRDKDNYILYSSTLNDVIANDLDLITPTAYYATGDTNEHSDNDDLSSIYCIVTLGSQLDLQINNYFETGQYLEGLLLSALGDEVLYSLSNDLHIFLQSNLDENTYLTKKFEIGDYPPEFNQVIYDFINNEDKIEDIHLTTNYMLSNSKSMVYFYSVSKNNCGETSHNCNTCFFKECNRKQLEITIKNTCTTLSCFKFDNLLDILNKNNININSYCNGNGTCKKCKINIDINGVNSSVLACDYYVVDNITIDLPKTDNNISIQSDYKYFPYKKDKFTIKKINSIDLVENKSFESLLEKKLSVNTLKKINNLKTLEAPMELLIKNNEEIIDIGSNITGYTICIDVGTTTVVVALVDIVSGNIIATEKFINPQKKYGGDIVSRINYATNNHNILTTLIVDKINLTIDNLVNNYECVHNIVVSGNTTMMYLLCGINPSMLATTPFSFGFNSITKVNSTEIFHRNYGTVTILPSISAYVGGDIVAGILGTDLLNCDKNILLVDIGTNGEIVLKSNKFYCCSTAAGPVFEGSNIECGSPSVEGAIYSVTMANNKFLYETIGNMPPIGICGSGVIDIVSQLLTNNIIDENGLMENFEKINITDHIYFSQKDIRALQLAKSSILTGIDTLLSKANIGYEDIDLLYLGGGFGSNISVENTVKIGLLPLELQSKIIPVGNCGLFGTIKYATSKVSEYEVNLIIKNAEHIELATNDFFTEKYIENINFKIN